MLWNFDSHSSFYYMSLSDSSGFEHWGHNILFIYDVAFKSLLQLRNSVHFKKSIILYCCFKLNITLKNKLALFAFVTIQILFTQGEVQKPTGY